MSDIPDWAIKAALDRVGVGRDQLPLNRWRDRSYADAVRELARVIFTYQEASPVDPDVEAVKRIIEAWEDWSVVGWGSLGTGGFYSDALDRAVAQYKKEKTDV